MFQSSFELTGYITDSKKYKQDEVLDVSKLFRAYRLYNGISKKYLKNPDAVSKLFRAYRLYNSY